jgi:hypothetical protein
MTVLFEKNVNLPIQGLPPFSWVAATGKFFFPAAGFNLAY